MKPSEQLKILSEIDIPLFKDKIEELGNGPLMAESLDVFQINLGKLCNMTCSHCHVEAGPDRTEIMTKETLEICLDAIKKSGASTVDLTGGAPEMNPDLEWFLVELNKLGKRVIVRSNLTVLLVPKYSKYISVFTENNVEVVASLPCYEEANTDAQRGNLVFQRSLKVLKLLNDKGYGKEGTGLVLNLVHNPVGTHLPPAQAKLEADYKRRLFDDFGVSFNSLFCITNMPISRYLEYLKDNGELNDYLHLLVNSFSSSSVANVMCRNTISISWDGFVYDCDFNQMLGLPVSNGAPANIKDFDLKKYSGRKIVVHNHCYGCTAGEGSSCQGSLN
ncbi:radical SAM/Cys-rich domain protein [bacterium]|jgi:radical SAM/Cys-rich protein|nr:radical SAM/Cys-rich domain protein [bacterium]